MTSPRVLLLWPGTEGAAAGNFGVPQLVTIASYVRARTGVAVEVVDLACERAFGRVDLRRILSGPDGKGYDVLGLSCYASFDYLKIEAIARIARELFPDVVIVTGGYHVSARPTEFITDGSPFDVAVVGEGEKPFTKVVESVTGGAPLRGVILGPDPIDDLDELAPSDWSVLDRYRPIARQVASQVELYLSRGCPFDCAFCMERAKREVSWRPFSVERALDEMKRLDAFLGLSDFTVYFADALFGMRKRWRREFLEGLAKSGIQTKKNWLLVRVDMIDEEDLKLFGQANCGLGFGLESGDPSLLATIRKAGRLDTYLDNMLEISARARELDVPWGANVIVGHPGETEATLRTSAKYLEKLFLDAKGVTGFLSVDPFRLYPGSPIDDERAAWEERFGTRFHRPTWWHDGDQEFLAEWVDPSADLTYRRREALSHELLSPVLRGIPEHFVYRGPARDYFQRAIDDQIDNLERPYRMHYLDRYYAWNRYVGNGRAARRELATDEAAAALCAQARDATLDRVARTANGPDADVSAFRASELGRALLEVPRERFVPLDELRASGHDIAIGLDASGLATVSAMHAYARTFELAGVRTGMRVLDLGGGTGYGAAILSRLVGAHGRVVTLEIDPRLVALAREHLAGLHHVTVMEGDGVDATVVRATVSAAGGVFDAVVAGFAVTEIPDSWKQCLARDGVLVAPVVTAAAPDAAPCDAAQPQRLMRGRWVDGAFVSTALDDVMYVRARAAADIVRVAPAAPAQDRSVRRSLPLAR